VRSEKAATLPEGRLARNGFTAALPHVTKQLPANRIKTMQNRRLSLSLALLCTLAAAQANAAPPERTASGLVYESIKDGSGEQPNALSSVQVHYRGTLANGSEFDSSYKRGQPATFPLNRVIPCWTEGVAKMREGGKAKLTCPPEIAYGSRGAGSAVPPNATLTFEVELLKVMR
jgi:FKBP-type peptidyl-prolyl cis-trans isomerase FkpA